MRARVERGQTVVRAVLLVAAVALIGVLLYRQVSRLSVDRVNVWVSATDLKPGQVVTPGLMRQVQMPPAKGAYVERSAIEGRAMVAAKAAGQPFYPADLAPRPVPPALATTIPAGRLLATVKVAALDLPTEELRTGDRLDIIQAGFGGEVQMIAHDAYMMGVMNSGSGRKEKATIMGVDLTPPDPSAPPQEATALVLGVFPEDVFPLAKAESSSQRMKIVLHSDAEVKSGVLLTPDPPKPEAPGKGLPSVEVIVGKKRETVYAADDPRRVVFAPPAPKKAADSAAPKRVGSR